MLPSGAGDELEDFGPKYDCSEYGKDVHYCKVHHIQENNLTTKQ